MHAYPRYDPNRTQVLDGLWRFAFLPDVGDPDALVPGEHDTPEPMPVPGCFDAAPAFAGRRGAGLYRATAEVAPNTPAELRFDGLGLWCKLFVDGHDLGTHDLPYSGWSVLLPPAEQRRPS